VLAALALAAPAYAADDAEVVSSRSIDDRLLELTVRTPALTGDTKVRVLLPSDYASDPGRRYPVLYLLHGASGNYANWSLLGDTARTTAGQPLIVVMPDGGRGGWYSDWYNGGQGGPPEWERYHIDQLIPLVDRRFRTIAARRGRAIAGLSMGGFGALSYAGRHPDLFTYAASFSGGVDVNVKVAGIPAGQVAVAGTVFQDGGSVDSIFGNFKSRNIGWRGHNPRDLAANLRGLGLALYTGNGVPGGPLGGSTLDIIELGAHKMSERVHNRLDKLGIANLWDDYGPGAHTWPYWARDLRDVLPSLMKRFAEGVTTPERVTYTSIEPSYSVYGWRVAVRRPNVEFSTLREARSDGFALTGSGRATVTTPARFRAGAGYRVRIAGPSRTVTRTLTAASTGRLRIGVRLARTNRSDQGSPEAKASGTWNRATTKVSIRLR
jgi:S-formylglutathione hydrolase FrmB